jgi:hypothetical protein
LCHIIKVYLPCRTGIVLQPCRENKKL